MSKDYKSFRSNEHPLLSTGNIFQVIAVHRFILYEKLGPGTHPCHWCGKLLTWGGRGPTSIQTDHIDTVKSHNDPSNLVASCKRCNNMRTCTGINRPVGDNEIFIEQVHPDGHVTRVRALIFACEICGKPSRCPVSARNRGAGRFCCRSHARRAPRVKS
jgi:hypothetical protein